MLVCPRLWFALLELFLSSFSFCKMMEGSSLCVSALRRCRWGGLCCLQEWSSRWPGFNVMTFWKDWDCLCKSFCRAFLICIQVFWGPRQQPLSFSVVHLSALFPSVSPDSFRWFIFAIIKWPGVHNLRILHSTLHCPCWSLHGVKEILHYC